MAHTEDVERLASQLRFLKERAGLSFEALAKRTGAGKSSLHRYCAGKKVPVDPGVIYAFAQACGASRGELQELHKLWAVADIGRSEPSLAVQRDDEREQVLEEEVVAPTRPSAPAAQKRHRLRRPSPLASLAAVAALVALNVNDEPRLPSNMSPVAVDTTLHTDPGDSPPHHFVAAGQIALSAYQTVRLKKSTSVPANDETITRTWYLYDKTSGGYRKVPGHSSTWRRACDKRPCSKVRSRLPKSVCST